MSSKAKLRDIRARLGGLREEEKTAAVLEEVRDLQLEEDKVVAHIVELQQLIGNVGSEGGACFGMARGARTDSITSPAFNCRHP